MANGRGRLAIVLRKLNLRKQSHSNSLACWAAAGVRLRARLCPVNCAAESGPASATEETRKCLMAKREGRAYVTLL